jgi:hypothetical protein
MRTASLGLLQEQRRQRQRRRSMRHHTRQNMRRGHRPTGDEKACLDRDDVRRVAAFICEPDIIEAQTDRFMAAFDPAGTGTVTLRQFLGEPPTRTHAHTHATSHCLNAHHA